MSTGASRPGVGDEGDEGDKGDEGDERYASYVADRKRRFRALAAEIR
jgi:hypothetical protein